MAPVPPTAVITMIAYFWMLRRSTTKATITPMMMPYLIRMTRQASARFLRLKLKSYASPDSVWYNVVDDGQSMVKHRLRKWQWQLCFGWPVQDEESALAHP